MSVVLQIVFLSFKGKTILGQVHILVGNTGNRKNKVVIRLNYMLCVSERRGKNMLINFKLFCDRVFNLGEHPVWHQSVAFPVHIVQWLAVSWIFVSVFITDRCICVAYWIVGAWRIKLRKERYSMLSTIRDISSVEKLSVHKTWWLQKPNIQPEDSKTLWFLINYSWCS